MTGEKTTPGRFVWRELMTSDPQRAKGFYGELFGWTFDDVDMGEPTGVYHLAKLGGKNVGGIMKMPSMMKGVPTHWLSYVSVADVDAAAKIAAGGGGKVAAGPMDIPNVGRFATVVDPQGAALALFKSSMGDREPAMPQKGEFCWETLVTSDVAASKAFYGKVVGWSTQTMPGGGIEVFSVGEGPQNSIADIQEAENMRPAWMTYVVVETIEAANDRASKLGAKVVMPLIEIPNVGRISMIADPTGGHLGLYQPQQPA